MEKRLDDYYRREREAGLAAKGGELWFGLEINLSLMSEVFTAEDAEVAEKKGAHKARTWRLAEAVVG
jgi:hypothetical protein